MAALVFLVGALSCKQETPSPAVDKAPPPAPKPAVVTTVNLPPNSWQVPVDVSPTPPPNPPQNNYLNLGWQTFVALNWPALSPSSGGQNAQPDTNSVIGAVAPNGAIVPTVWNTYRDLSTIMLDQGADPGSTYTQQVSIPSACAAITPANPVAPGFQPMYIDGSTFQTATIVRDYINQATGNPLVDQKGWYTITDIRVDPSEYAYIQQNGYYLGANQVAAYNKSGQLQPFPKNGTEITPPLPSYAQYGALEVKATWRVLNPSTDSAIIPRYYTQWGYFMQPDGKTCQGPALFGLIGMHILRLTPSMGGTWFWASFQQVDNVAAPNGIAPTLAKLGTPNGNCGGNYNKKPPQVTGNIPWNGNNTPDDICQVKNIPSEVQQVNQTWQKNLSGTVWQYYEMVHTLNPCPSGAKECYVFPPIKDQNNKIDLKIFGNNAIETYFQTSNCMTCHGSASGNGAPSPLTGTNQIFTFVLLNAYMPQTTQTNAKRSEIKRLLEVLPQSDAVAMHP
ncbi:MAG: hypothetical protein JO197_01155 [Acidobacteria bacterium]|nr:hypothetical protein [Acidobacteriota bacterium]